MRELGRHAASNKSYGEEPRGLCLHGLNLPLGGPGACDGNSLPEKS
jgi:hypothetical protein